MNPTTQLERPGIVWASYRRPARGDDRALVQLFRECFPNASDESPTSSVQGWRWKYAQTPVASHSLATLDDTTGQFVSFIGGLRMSATAFGEQTTITQSVDNMTAPDYRYAVSGVPVYTDLLVEWVRDGFGPGKSLMAYGFPTRLNMRVGTRAVESHIVEDLRILVRPVQTHRATPNSSSLRTTWSGGPPRDTDELWQRCRGDHTIVVNRDRRYLLWRYTLHPTVPFRFISVRDALGLRGLAVVTPHRTSPEVQLIVDWVVPLGDDEAADALLAEIDVRTSVCGGRQLGVWFPIAHAWSSCFLKRDFSPHPWDRPWSAHSCDSRFKTEDVGRLMYATLGDVDSF